MAHIDITLYANGALRLSRHGKGRGGNVLMHVASGRQVNVSDATAQIIDDVLTHPDSYSARSAEDALDYFEYIEREWRTGVA